MAVCGYCNTRLDPVWAEAGYDTHVTCEPGMACPHGELRGRKACAICRNEAGAAERAKTPLNRNAQGVQARPSVLPVIAAEIIVKPTLF